MQAVRPAIEEAIAGDASITSALAGMLEVLPQGASKAAGIEVVLETLGIQSDEIMAMGDAENDLQMLKMAGVRMMPSYVLLTTNTRDAACVSLSCICYLSQEGARFRLSHYSRTSLLC